MPDELKRVTLDLAEYSKSSQSDPCFICRVIDGTHDFPHEVVYRDHDTIAFLNRFPTLLGYCLVAPIEHRVDVMRDFTASEYLRLQAVVHHVGVAVTEVVPTERVYVLSLGSNQGNAHVYWHIAPLPPDVPYGQQQFSALMIETQGYIDLADDEQRILADKIRTSLTDRHGNSSD